MRGMSLLSRLISTRWCKILRKMYAQDATQDSTKEIYAKRSCLHLMKDLRIIVFLISV
jgi:hypothetical protein